jgi:hypothetical protein
MENVLLNLFKESFDEFLVKEKSGISNTVSERNMCGRLVIYLNNRLEKFELSKYYVDPEYNRKQNGEIKTMIDNDLNVVTINCDIIVHSRGESIKADNLLAIEMKKAERPEDEKNKDRIRLRALTKDSYNDTWSNDGTTHPEHVCGYVVGLYIEIDPKEKICLIEHYKKGNKVNEWIEEIA